VKRIALFSLLFVAGCGPYKVSVYGKSGAAFTAPSLCAALVQCMNSSETACYYDRTLYRDVDGKTLDESGCKEVKK
jgi:hypothetical protein